MPAMSTEKRATLPELNLRPSGKVISRVRLPWSVNTTSFSVWPDTSTGAQANQRSPEASVSRVMVCESPLAVRVPSSPQYHSPTTGVLKIRSTLLTVASPSSRFLSAMRP